jgi:DNA-binding transcriptional MerR regulator
MVEQIRTPQSQSFEQIILKKLDEIEKRLDAKTPPAEPLERYFQPKELCTVYGITRNTLEKFFQVGLLTPLRFSPTSRKIYVAESQIKQVLKSKLPIVEN